MADGRTESIRVRVTPGEKARLQTVANAVTNGNLSDLMRNRALGIADVAAPAALAQRGEVKTTASGPVPSNGAPKSEPTRGERIAQRTAELRAEGVGTYAARDRAASEISEEDWDAQHPE